MTAFWHFYSIYKRSILTWSSVLK